MAKFLIQHEVVGHFRRGDVVDQAQFPFSKSDVDAGRTVAFIDRLVGMGAIGPVPDDTALFISDATVIPAPAVPPPAPEEADDKPAVSGFVKAPSESKSR